MRVDFLGGAYEGRSKHINAQECINLFLEPEFKEKSRGALIGTVGYTEFADSGVTAEVRGAIRFPGTTPAADLVHFVAGNSLYSMNSAGSVTDVSAAASQTFNTSTGPVIMAHNGEGNDIIIADGTDIWRYISGTTTISAVSGPSGSNSAAFHDGRFLVGDTGNKGRFYYSDIYDGSTFNAFAFSTAEGSPDDLLGVFVDRRQVYLFGEETTEVWYNTGDANNPYQRFQGGFIEWGCESIHTVQRFDNSIIWLARDKAGKAQVVRLGNNYIPEVVSTPSISYQLGQYTDLSDAISFRWKVDGHEFYVLTFPTGDATWVLDALTKEWHQWAGDISGNWPTRHRSNCYVYAFGKHLFGDYTNGKIYELSLSEYQEDGSNIKRRRTAPHISDEGDRVAVSRFEIDAETGVGNADDTDPTIDLSYSKDSGHNFSTPVSVKVGQSTEKKKRPATRKLGSTRHGWVFRAYTESPVKWVISGAWIKVRGEKKGAKDKQ